MTNEELKALLVESVIAKVLARGVPANKANLSYIRSAVGFVPNPDNSPQLVVTDPVSGKVLSADTFAEAMAADPDFRPPAAASHSEAAKPRHVSSDDLASGRQLVDLKDIAEGRVIVDVPPARGVAEAQDGEVSWTDQRGLNRNLEKIASGEVVVR